MTDNFACASGHSVFQSIMGWHWSAYGPCGTTTGVAQTEEDAWLAAEQEEEWLLSAFKRPIQV